MSRKTAPHIGILLASAATLLFELGLMRLFAVIEWYHFAFLSISVALLGYASSGTWLSVLAGRARRRLWPVSLIAFPLSIVACYVAINRIPFDSYQLAWAPIQMLYLVLYYACLVVPFLLSGWIVGYQIAAVPERSNTIYAANLVGSALGSAGLLAALPLLGAESTSALAAILAAVGGAALSVSDSRRSYALWPTLAIAAACGYLVLAPPSWMAPHLSPYKSLSYALQTPGARLTYQAWNASARIDVVESDHIHSAPGLSLNYRGALPPQYGLTVDGSDLSAITRRLAPEDFTYLEYLPSTLPQLLRPEASALLIYPRGGTDVSVALHLGARRVLVIEDNPLILEVMRERYDGFVAGLYRSPQVGLVSQDGRSMLQRGDERYDIIQLCLWHGYHPLTTGSYSLTEDHLYTVESLAQALQRLTPNGILVLTRWLQDPPSESVRAAAALITAMESVGISAPGEHLLAFRSWATMTLMASRSPFHADDIALLRETCRRLGYDLVHHAGILPEDVNRHNVLPEPVYYAIVQDLLDPSRRNELYTRHPYDISPPTDDRPFFAHYFRWRQVPGILSQVGRTWQPFGGSGFLLVLILLLASIVISLLLVILPLCLRRGARMQAGRSGRVFAYFACLGFGYLLVEMPLMQQFILYLGQAAVAFSTVLAFLLLASGLGSYFSARIRFRLSLPTLVALIMPYPYLLRGLFQATLGWSFAARVALSGAALLPLGFLMGIPFAAGLRKVEGLYPGLTPWIWAINGGASVVSSILATVMALAVGYRAVLGLAALCYLAAAVAIWPLARGEGARPSGRP